MKYAYEDLSDNQFEKLVVLLCHDPLGATVAQRNEQNLVFLEVDNVGQPSFEPH